MARILALDYGKVRTGIAVTDELQLIASGLTTVETKDLLPFLVDYLDKEPVESLWWDFQNKWTILHQNLKH